MRSHVKCRRRDRTISTSLLLDVGEADEASADIAVGFYRGREGWQSVENEVGSGRGDS